MQTQDNSSKMALTSALHGSTACLKQMRAHLQHIEQEHREVLAAINSCLQRVRTQRASSEQQAIGACRSEAAFRQETSNFQRLLERCRQPSNRLRISWQQAKPRCQSLIRS